MTPPSIDVLRDLVPGYLLDTLTPEERETMDRALRDPGVAEALAPEMEAMREAAEALGAGSPAAPPLALRARVLDRIASESRTSAAAPVRLEHDTQPRERMRRRRTFTVGLAIAAAASTVVAVDLGRQVRVLREEVAVQRDSSAATVRRLAEREATLRALLDGGGALRLVRLVPNVNGGPSLQLFWNVERGRAVLHVSGLKPLPTARTYQLWMIRDGAPVSVALFRTDSSGAQLLRDVPVASSLRGVTAFAVTEEPASGSPQPTMTPFLVGAVGTE